MLRLVRYLALLTLASLITIAVSYELALRYAATYEAGAESFDAVLDKANTLRANGNRLARLAQSFEENRVRYGAESEAFRGWMQTKFTPRLNELRQILTVRLEDIPEITPLSQAAESLSAVAVRPGDATLRESALSAVLAATEETESRIDAWAVSKYLYEKPHRFRWIAQR